MKQYKNKQRTSSFIHYFFILIGIGMLSVSSAQEGQAEVGLLLGNNGQLDKTLNDFYFWGSETHYLDDSNLGKGNNFKFGVSGRYFFTNTISARLKAGYAVRNGFDSRIYWNEHTDYTLKHNVWNVHPALCFSKQMEQLEITTGLELPLFFVTPFSLVMDDTQLGSDSVTVVSSGKSTIRMSKGFVWGLNNFIQVKYFITDALAIGGEISYGLLFAQLGNRIEMTNESTFPVISSNTDIIEKTYKKNFFSTPEVALGIFFRFGSGAGCIVPGKKK